MSTKFKPVDFETSACTRLIEYSDLYVNESRMIVYESQTFEDCFFRGPYVACVFGDFSATETQFMNCGDIIPVDENTGIAGAACFIDCTFNRCLFERVQLLAHPSARSSMMEHMSSGSVRH